MITTINYAIERLCYGARGKYWYEKDICRTLTDARRVCEKTSGETRIIRHTKTTTTTSEVVPPEENS